MKTVVESTDTTLDTVQRTEYKEGLMSYNKKHLEEKYEEQVSAGLQQRQAGGAEQKNMGLQKPEDRTKKSMYFPDS